MNLTPRAFELPTPALIAPSPRAERGKGGEVWRKRGNEARQSHTQGSRTL